MLGHLGRSLLITLAVGLLCPAPSALANLYNCRDATGRLWIRNYKVPGEKCKLAMKTDGAEPAAPAEPGQAKLKTKSSFKPPTAGIPRAVDEPSSAKARRALYEPYIAEAAEQYQLPATFIRAVIRVESNFHYKAVSSAGAQGLMQLMPRTGRSMGVNDAFDPRQNVMGGARLLRVLANRFQGDFVKVLSAYHAGSGAVAKKGGIPYQQTESYVRAVLDHYYQYKALGASG